MFIQEAELFKGFDEQTMAEMTKIMVAQSFKSGTVLFTKQDQANTFYILWEGRVRLAIGTQGKIDYTASKRGEAFGWSSLVGRETYTATAECVAPTKLFTVAKDELAKLFEKLPRDGMLFYQRLAAAIVQRLLLNYDSYLSQGGLTGVTSYGTGQVTEPQET
jgi:CRP-like cAMP-binding protein